MVSCVFQVLLLFHQKVNWNLLEKPTVHGDTMKKIQSIFPLLSFVGIILLLAACSPNELGTPFYTGQEVSISAALSSSKNNDGKKRISGKDNVDKINLTWDEGDKILVTVGNQSAVFTLSTGAGTNNATFKGAMPANGISYSVSYPVGYSDDMLDVQPYVENGFGKGLMKMSTKTEGTIDNSFTLSADNALLGLQLTGDVVVRKIVVTNKDNKNTYTLDCSAHEVRATEGRVFYIVLPADTWSNGMKVEVYNAEGVVIETKEKYDAITFSANNAMMMPEVAVHGYVDLGLSVMWATCNVGATFPEEYGDYFAWGEVEKKEVYLWSNYKHGTTQNITKYNATDGFTILQQEDDAAFVNFGKKWRIPTADEQKELMEQCEWIWTKVNNTAGYQVVGPNGNHIFLPAAGYITDIANQPYNANVMGYQWASTKKSGITAYRMHFGIDGTIEHYSGGSRACGASIRPVYSKPATEDFLKQYRYGFTQAEWDAATDSWGHGGRAHAPADQSCIQGTIVRGIRLKVGREGSIDVYKVPSLLETTTDNFQLVTTFTADSRGVTDFDFAHPIYIGKNEYLVFGHPLKSPPTLLPCYNPKSPSQPFAHFIGTEKAKMAGASLMVDFY